MRAENQEFIALFEASGWNQAYASKRLYTTPATISRYLTKAEDKCIPPPKSTIELFKFILASEKPGALSSAASGKEPLEDWEKKVLEDLRGLREDCRKSVLEVIKTVIEYLEKLNSAPQETVEPTDQVDPKKVPVILPGSPPAHVPSSKVKAEVDRRIAAATDKIRSRRRTSVE